jgi:hypothetical protein
MFASSSFLSLSSKKERKKDRKKDRMKEGQELICSRERKGSNKINKGK